jgi:hypothetical protein
VENIKCFILVSGAYLVVQQTQNDEGLLVWEHPMVLRPIPNPRNPRETSMNAIPLLGPFLEDGIIGYVNPEGILCEFHSEKAIQIYEQVVTHTRAMKAGIVPAKAGSIPPENMVKFRPKK